MYSDKVMDHFEHPRNVGEIENASGVGTVGNAKCGDIMRIYLDIDDATHMIRDCKFKTLDGYKRQAPARPDGVSLWFPGGKAGHGRGELCRRGGAGGKAVYPGPAPVLHGYIQQRAYKRFLHGDPGSPVAVRPSAGMGHDLWPQGRRKNVLFCHERPDRKDLGTAAGG